MKESLDKEHAKNLGKLLQNLLTLELLLRLCILKKEGKIFPLDISELEEGDKVLFNVLTNRDDLEKVINRFHSYKNMPHKLDKEMVLKIRNAIVHGRLLSKKAGGSMWVFKFSKPKDGFVTIEVAQEMDSKWFNEAIDSIYSEVQNIEKVYLNLP